ncbi:MAG: hypothetical protein AB8H79_24295 [Myxococcota bacterium]
MTDTQLAQLSTGLGLTSMTLSATACASCGIGLLPAMFLAALGFMLARGALAEEVCLPEVRAWCMVGLWSSGLGGGFALLSSLTLLLGCVVWTVGGYGLASL